MNKKLLVVALGMFALASCGKKKTDTPYAGDPSKALVGIGNTDCPDCPVIAPPVSAPGAHGEKPAPALPDHQTISCNQKANGVGYPEGSNTSQGSRDGYDFGQGGGCLHRPIREVLAVSLNRPLMVWNEVDDSTFLSYSPPDHVNFFYSVEYNVHRIITVSWNMDWYYSVIVGSVAAPEKVLINYKKTKGTSHISYWEGSIILDRVNDTISSMTMLNQIDAEQNNAQDAEDAVKDVYGKLRTGAPDWSMLN